MTYGARFIQKHTNTKFSVNFSERMSIMDNHEVSESYYNIIKVPREILMEIFSYMDLNNLYQVRVRYELKSEIGIPYLLSAGYSANQIIH